MLRDLRSEGLSKRVPGERIEGTKALKRVLGITRRSVGLRFTKEKECGQS